MPRIILDRETIKKLGNLEGTSILCDSDGKAFATLSPTTDKQLQPQITDEELDFRIKNPGKLHTTEEVLKHLKSLS